MRLFRCCLCFVSSGAPDVAGPSSACGGGKRHQVRVVCVSLPSVVPGPGSSSARGSCRFVSSVFRCRRSFRGAGSSSARGSCRFVSSVFRVVGRSGARGCRLRAAAGRSVRRSFAGRSAVASAAGNTSNGRRFRPAMPSVPFARYVGRRQGGSVRSSDLSRDAASEQDAAERSSLAAYCGAHRVRLHGALCGPVPIRGNRCRSVRVPHPLRGAAPRRRPYSSPAASLATMRTPTASMPCAGRTGAIVSR